MDLCSVVIPTHNRRERVIKTLATIQAQIYEPLEIVIRDDGSTDGTYEALQQLPDDRIILTRSEKASGVANARNAGLAASSGRWVAFCDDDDLWHPNKIHNQISAMKQSGSRWAVSDAIDITDEFEFMRADIGKRGPAFRNGILFGNHVPGGCSNVIAEKALLTEAGGGFDANLSMIADWDMWIRLSLIEGPAFTNSLDLLYLHHSGQMSTDLEDTNAEVSYFRDKHATARSAVAPPRFELIDYWIVRRMWKAGQYRDAVKTAFNSNGRLSALYGLKGIAIEVVKANSPALTSQLKRVGSQSGEIAATEIDAARTIEDIRSVLDSRPPQLEDAPD